MEDSLIKYRSFLEKMWLESHQEWEDVPKILSTHMCRYTCIFIQKILQQDHGLVAEIVTGCPLKNRNGTSGGKYGFQDKHGNWHDHSWLVIGSEIIDVTADQFGGDEIIITSLFDKRYKPSPKQQIFIKSLDKLSIRAQKWFDAYKGK
jgi:hypothetical protein